MRNTGYKGLSLGCSMMLLIPTALFFLIIIAFFAWALVRSAF